MNVLVVGKFYIEGFALHIAETLEAMGHSVRRYEPGHRSARIPGRLGHRMDQVGGVIHAATDSLPAVRSWRMRELRRTVEQAPLDVVIVCHDFLWPTEVADLKRRSRAAVALWFPDALVNFGRGFFMTAPYDAVFFKDPYSVFILKDKLFSPVYYLPECFNPEKHCVREEGAADPAIYRCDITTAGNQHSYRVAFFQHLTGYDVKIWGSPAPLWMNSGPAAGMFQGRPVHNHEKARAFRAAKIVVNNLHYGEIWGTNARTFEAAGIGAFQMVDWRPGLGQLFEDGKELVCFHDMPDLKKKIDHWLPREEERRAVAEAGMSRAFAEHTYQLRLSLLLDILAGKAKAFPVPDLRTLSGGRAC